MSNLAEILRPESLDAVIGQDAAKRAIQSWVEKDNFPRCQLYTGPVGTGKSTLAGIVAKACQGSDWDEGCDIRQINAGTVGKVDDARALAAESASRPFIGRYRVFTLEEAHRMTDAAQDAILVPMEVNPWTMWLLTSSEPEKLLPAIRSRCSAATFALKPLNRDQIATLVRSVKPNLTDDEYVKWGTWFVEKSVTSPREILGVLDQHFAGVPLEQAVHGAEHEPLYPEIATAVLSGNWSKTSGLLKQIKTADYRAMVAVVSAKMSWALLEEGFGPRGDAIATCLVGLGVNQFADGVAYSSLKALLYKCCRTIGGGK